MKRFPANIAALATAIALIMACSSLLAENDAEPVIAAFADLQLSCLSCHQRFRKPFKAHFYGQQ